MKLYKRIAGLLNARNNCIISENYEWQEKHEIELEKIDNLLPSGSRIDSGSNIVLDNYKDNMFYISSGYHVMNENGMYVEWINFHIKVTASLQFDFELNIKGNFGKYQDIKDYLYDVYNDSLNEEVV
jgi:hypothetical protein